MEEETEQQKYTRWCLEKWTQGYIVLEEEESPVQIMTWAGQRAMEMNKE